MAAAGPWKAAFQKAKLTEEEGAKDFADFLQETKKRKLEEATLDEDTEITDDTVLVKSEKAGSGYSQPVQLADFVKKVRALGTINSTEIKELTEESVINPAEEISTGIDARQICRTWLKNHFLGIGSPCNKNPCPRKHEVVGNPDRLYSDFSFKGLPAKHKTVILNALKGK